MPDSSEGVFNLIMAVFLDAQLHEEYPVKQQPPWSCYVELLMGKRRKVIPHSLDFGRGRHGGKRVGAGRKKRSRLVHHAKRQEFVRDSVMHVTIGLREGLCNLRRKREVKAIWRAVAELRESGLVSEDRFRLLQLSVQRDHLHLAVEAKSQPDLSSAIQRLKQRIGHALRRLWKLTRVRGSIYSGRYHVRLAETPTEVRRLFAYVLGNARHHGTWKKASTDPYSTASEFAFWHSSVELTAACDSRPIVSPPRSWLAKTGWKRAGRKGPLHLTEVALP